MMMMLFSFANFSKLSTLCSLLLLIHSALVQAMLKAGSMNSARRGSLINQASFEEAPENQAQESSVKAWLVRQSKYLKTRPEQLMNYQNLLNWRPNAAGSRKTPKKSSDSFSGQKSQENNFSSSSAEGFKVDVTNVASEIERKIKLLHLQKSKLVDAIEEIKSKPSEAVKPNGLLKKFLAVPDWCFPMGNDNLKANKLIAKVEDASILQDIAEALLVDLNNFIPTENEISVYQQMLFTKAELIQACGNVISDFPLRNGQQSRQFTLQQIMDLQENSIEERESVSAMLKNYLESLKHEHKLELADVKAKLSLKVASFAKLVEQAEQANSNSNDEQVSKLLQEVKELLDSVRTAFYSQKLSYCDEQMQKLERFEKTTLGILQELTKSSSSKSNQESETSLLLQKQKLASKNSSDSAAGAGLFQHEMAPTEIVQILKEAAALNRKIPKMSSDEQPEKIPEQTSLSNSNKSNEFGPFHDDDCQAKSSSPQDLGNFDEACKLSESSSPTNDDDQRRSLHNLISISEALRRKSIKDLNETRREANKASAKTVAFSSSNHHHPERMSQDFVESFEISQSTPNLAVLAEGEEESMKKMQE